jgi:plasmid maintenance system antidote protein VapI
MQLHDYMEIGITKKGSVTALASYLGIAPNSVTDAKAHRRSLPADACVKLSDLLNVELKTIIAASELATERKEEKRAFWLPFVTNAKDLTRAASYALILGIVTNFVTTTEAEARNSAVSSQYGTKSICIMLSCRY